MLSDLEIVELSIRRAKDKLQGSTDRTDVKLMLDSIADSIRDLARERIEREHNAVVYGKHCTDAELGKT